MAQSSQWEGFVASILEAPNLIASINVPEYWKLTEFRPGLR